MERAVRRALLSGVAALLGAQANCRPNIALPPVPAHVPAAANSSDVALARSLAPVLHVQRDEPFTLDRVVAVLHPTLPIIAYHLLWSHDINGQWVPWAKASDAEEVWVGYDPVTKSPTDIWTYWHGDILHADWRDRGAPAIAVQWGKHGSLPFGVRESDLPSSRTLNFFYVAEFALIPDIALGKISHGGPIGFFHSYKRYRDFSLVVPLESRLDAVVRASDPGPALRAVFGRSFADKQHWPRQLPMLGTPGTRKLSKPLEP